jgi:hypothetical protein
MPSTEVLSSSVQVLTATEVGHHVGRMVPGLVDVVLEPSGAGHTETHRWSGRAEGQTARGRVLVTTFLAAGAFEVAVLVTLDDDATRTRR